MGDVEKYVLLTFTFSVLVFLFWLTSWRLSPQYGISIDVKSISGATGKLFQMRRIRSFPKSKLKKSEVPRSEVDTWKEGRQCKKWVVITTINEPTRTVEQVSSLKSWCSVLVLDKKTPTPFLANSAVVLTVEDQQKLSYRILRSIPWNHFGRKNIGYLYAIAHGAEIIYDCDDDNELITTIEESTAIPVSLNRQVVSSPPRVVAFNPYPSFGNAGGWPRGFPLDQILNRTSYSLTESANIYDENNFWIHQSLANNDPDYDAIYRLTHPLPVTFTAHIPIAISTGTMTPYNAQATLHFKPAFWGLLLPITVHGRVSDIWRSYITQRLLWKVGGQVVFRSPWVVQYRNAHNYLADFDSEYDLYKKAPALIQYLRSWSCGNSSLPECLLSLMIEMYDFGIIDKGDVMLMHDWVQDLTSVGYKFPEFTQRKNF